MVRSIQDNGIHKQKQKKVMVYKYGQMEANMKAFGIMTWQEDLEDSFWQMGIYI